MKLIDLSGKRFGRLTVLSLCGRTKTGNAVWLCKCDCGNEKQVRSSMLIRGRTSSCGCLAAELSKMRGVTHGKTGTRLYRIWRGMRARCFSETEPAYKWYGGRGIAVCQEWEDFQRFYDWAMTHGYEGSLTIDRIDNDGDYEPSNCRWVTMKVQANNRQNTHYVTVDGEERPLAIICEERGLNYASIMSRYKRGEPLEHAVSTPVSPFNRRNVHSEKIVTLNGRSQNIKEWAREYGIKPPTLYNRLNKCGMTLEEALTTPVGGLQNENA